MPENRKGGDTQVDERSLTISLGGLAHNQICQKMHVLQRVKTISNFSTNEAF